MDGKGAEGFHLATTVDPGLHLYIYTMGTGDVGEGSLEEKHR